MILTLKLEKFLADNRISDFDWKAANIEWPTLQLIGSHYEKQAESLRSAATFFADIVQNFDAVHSVRWRLKDTQHLLAKIVRKRALGNQKYAQISCDNYSEIVTDLIGIRALHLFKQECVGIVGKLKEMWLPLETPIVFTRSGDSADLSKLFESNGFEIKDHPSGYRSVHYVFKTELLGREIVSEIQIRTVFEEAWSEIDHRVRYPNHSKNETLEYFLAIFNRMAGSADEMGSFVLSLETTISKLELNASTARHEKAATIRDMESTLDQLQEAKAQDEESKKMISKLKAEVSKLKEQDRKTTVSPLAFEPANVRPGLVNYLDSQNALLKILATDNATQSWLRDNASIEKAIKFNTPLVITTPATESIAIKFFNEQDELSKAMRAIGMPSASESMAMKVFAQQDEVSKAIGAIGMPSGSESMAMKVFAQQDELSKAMKATGMLSATESMAMKALSQQDELSTAMKAAGTLSATESMAMKALSQQDELTRRFASSGLPPELGGRK